MQDTVFIEGLRIDALIGVHAHERHALRPLVFDIQMRFDNRIPALSDALADALDYHAVSMRLVEFVGQTRFNLVETLAEQCAALILGEFGAAGVRLKLSKPGAFEAADTVGVVIERGSFAS
ncbi:MAG: dihydroneopterin aldolase [Thermomonas sp.]|uniref:dihydroneopterin aldolase n=1 Tax=Thermomonas sp. TaxID=1971895 RepID=UPI0039E64280